MLREARVHGLESLAQALVAIPQLYIDPYGGAVPHTPKLRTVFFSCASREQHSEFSRPGSTSVLGWVEGDRNEKLLM